MVLDIDSSINSADYTAGKKTTIVFNFHFPREKNSSVS